jgi:hypothetical protein
VSLSVNESAHCEQFKAEVQFKQPTGHCLHWLFSRKAPFLHDVQFVAVPRQVRQVASQAGQAVPLK